jgi:acyl-CoA synthetase (AMP-forming)/AMP-acid ligase II
VPHRLLEPYYSKTEDEFTLGPSPSAVNMATTKQTESSLTTEAQLRALRADTTLGSANFLDRCAAFDTARDVDFLFLEHPITLPDGKERRAFSLNSLLEARRCLAGYYAALGISAGDIIAVCISDGIGPFLHYLALSSLGAAGAIINPSMRPDVAIAYLSENNLTRIVMDVTTAERTGLVERLSGLVTCEIIDGSGSAIELAPLPPEWPLQPEDSTLVMLSHTSGTTGIPKAVRFEHRQFFMGKRARLGQFAEMPEERVLSALPQSHSSALSHLETVVVHRLPTLIASNAVGEPLRKAIRDFAPTMVLGFPQTFASLMRSGVSAGEFPSVRRWVSMGDAAHVIHIRAMLTAAPNSRFIDAFGSSELGMALFTKTSTHDRTAPRRAIGRPAEIAIAKVLSDSGDELPSGKVGLLAVRSPTVTSGYYRRPELTRKAWRNGYFLTGDVGYHHHDEFFLVDRAVNVIASPGGPLYTLLLEEEVEGIAGVNAASVVGVRGKDEVVDECMLAILLLEKEDSNRAPEIARAAWRTLTAAIPLGAESLSPNNILVAVVRDKSALPTGATGKVLKRLLREMFPLFQRALNECNSETPGLLHVTNGSTSYSAADNTAHGASSVGTGTTTNFRPETPWELT